MTQRYTVETLAAGQPRPYADSIRHVRVTTEFFRAWLGDPKDPRSAWQMMDLPEDDMRKMLPHLRCGFTENTVYRLGEAKLDWLKKVSPGVWEFHTTDPYCD